MLKTPLRVETYICQGAAGRREPSPHVLRLPPPARVPSHLASWGLIVMMTLCIPFNPVKTENI